MRANFDALIVGGGPAGLMAAEQLSKRGLNVCVAERMGSCGRKFLIAGKGGLNLTHSEAEPAFSERYFAEKAAVRAWLRQFSPTDLRHFAAELGVPTKVGSSGRVFPDDLKAAPMMRAWLRRLRAAGVEFRYHHECVGLAPPPRGEAFWRAQFVQDANAQVDISARVIVLALGGGSWAKLGSDGSWQQWLAKLPIALDPLAPSNCGFERPWSNLMAKHFGAPIKPVVATVAGIAKRGEFIISEYGVEGSVIYALSHALRVEIQAAGVAELAIDLAPDVAFDHLVHAFQTARAGLSVSEKLKRIAHLPPAKSALVFEDWPQRTGATAFELATRVKALVLKLGATRDIDEAISTAGGVRVDTLSADLMAPNTPGLFFAGEMLNWDAPTGGYLLSASFASGFCAAQGAINYLKNNE
jgi:uncharacterized flavoprotein (TIGR03862 family)